MFVDPGPQLPPDLMKVLRHQREAATKELLSHWWSPAIVAPLVETILFAFVLFILRLAVTRETRLAPSYYAVMSLLGWLMHGANSLAVGRAVGFGLLAILFWRVAQDRNLSWAFGATVLGHFIWNSLALAVAAVRLST